MSQPVPLSCRHVLAAAVMAATAAAAQAEANPYYLGVGQSFTHASNPLLVADGQPKRSSTISSTSLVAGIDQPFGRQRFEGSANVSANRYSGLSEYNNVSYGLKLGLDWSTIERVSGNLRLLANQKLALSNPGDAPDIAKRNLQKFDAIDAVVRVGVVTPLTLEGSLGHRQLRYSAKEYDFREYDEDVGSVGARYRLSGALLVGAAARHTRTDFPRAVGDGVNLAYQADRVKRDDLDLNATWTPSGLSTVYARLSYSRARHSEATSQDYSGVTGELDWTWQATGKIKLITSLLRDTGSYATYYNFAAGLISGQSDNSRVSNTAQVRADYALSAKIGLNASLRHQQRSLTDTFSLSIGQPQTASGTDRTNAASIGVRWAPIRALTLSCDATHEQRSGSALSLAYRTNTFGCGGQFVIQ